MTTVNNLVSPTLGAKTADLSQFQGKVLVHSHKYKSFNCDYNFSKKSNFSTKTVRHKHCGWHLLHRAPELRKINLKKPNTNCKMMQTTHDDDDDENDVAKWQS